MCVTSALQLGAVNQKTRKAQTQANQDATPLGRQSLRQVWDQVVMMSGPVFPAEGPQRKLALVLS